MGIQLKDGLYIISQKELEALQQACETKKRDIVEAYIHKLTSTRQPNQVIQEKNIRIAYTLSATDEDNKLFQKIRSENKYLLNINLSYDGFGYEEMLYECGCPFVRTVNVLTYPRNLYKRNRFITSSKFNIVLPQQKSFIESRMSDDEWPVSYNNKRNKAIKDSGLLHISKDYIFTSDYEATVTSAENGALIVFGKKSDIVNLVSGNKDVHLGQGDDTATLIGGSGHVDLGVGKDKVLIKGGYYTVTLGQESNKISIINSTISTSVVNTTIKDFKSGRDKLVLINGTFFDDYTASRKNAHELSCFMTLVTSFRVIDDVKGAILTFEGNNRILFEKVSKKVLKNSLEIKLNKLDLNREFTAEKILPGLRFEIVTAKNELYDEVISYPRMKSFSKKELKALSNFPNYKVWGVLLDSKTYQVDSSYNIEIKESIALNMEDDVKRITKSILKNKNQSTVNMWENKFVNYTFDPHFSVLSFFKNTFSLQKAKKYKEMDFEIFQKDKVASVNFDDYKKDITFNYNDILNNGTFKSGDQNLEVKYLFVHYEKSTPRSAVLYDSKIEDLKGNKPIAGRALITGGVANELKDVIEGEYKSNYHNGQVMAYDISKGIDRVIVQSIAGNAHKGVDDKTKVRIAFGLFNEETNKIVVTPFSNSCEISQ